MGILNRLFGRREKTKTGLEAEDSMSAQQPKILPYTQAYISGVVRDQETNEPIYNAGISYEYIKTDPKFGFEGGAITDLNGQFIIPTIAEGTVALTVSLEGYKPSGHQLPVNGTSMDLDIRLEPQEGAKRPKRLFGKFSGVMSLRFESHYFIPDEKTVTSYFDEPDQIKCWVDLAPEIANFNKPNVRYEILCEGFLHGPGVYGHRGLSSHYLWIEKIFSATKV